MDRGLYVMVLEEIIKHYEALKLNGRQENQLRIIKEKIKYQIDRGEK